MNRTLASEVGSESVITIVTQAFFHNHTIILHKIMKGSLRVYMDWFVFPVFRMEVFISAKSLYCSFFQYSTNLLCSKKHCLSGFCLSGRGTNIQDWLLIFANWLYDSHFVYHVQAYTQVADYTSFVGVIFLPHLFDNSNVCSRTTQFSILSFPKKLPIVKPN